MKDLYTALGGVAEKNINQPGFGPNGNTCASRMSAAFFDNTSPYDDAIRGLKGIIAFRNITWRILGVNIMRAALLLFGLCLAGCADKTNTIGSPRPEALRDLEGYAIASCFTNQAEPYLKDQGDAWAAVIVQRMNGNLEALAAITEEVKRENAKGNMVVIRNESGTEKDKLLPVLYCGEIIDRPAVRAAIQKAVGKFNQ